MLIINRDINGNAIVFSFSMVEKREMANKRGGGKNKNKNKRNNMRRNNNNNNNNNIFGGGLSEILNVNPCTGKIHNEKVKINRSRLAMGLPHWKLSASTLSLWYNMYEGKLTKDKNKTEYYFQAVTELLGKEGVGVGNDNEPVRRGNALRRMATMRIFLDPRYIPNNADNKIKEYRIIDLNTLEEGTADYEEKCAALDWIMCWYATNQFKDHNDSIPSCKYGGKKTLTQWPNPRVHSNYFNFFKGDPRGRENAIDRQLFLGGPMFGEGEGGTGDFLNEYRKRLEPHIPPLLSALFESDINFMKEMRKNDCKLGATDISAVVGAMGAKGGKNVLGNPKILNRFLGGCNDNVAAQNQSNGLSNIQNFLTNPGAAFNRKYLESIRTEQAAGSPSELKKSYSAYSKSFYPSRD